MALNVPLAEVAADRRASKVVYLPVHENTYSGATTCLLQAMACSRPVITNPVAPTRRGYHLAGGENVVFVPSGDVNAAVNEISRLVQDDAERSRIGQRARDTTEKHLTLDRMIDSIMSEVNTCYRTAFGDELPLAG
jgi:glycosyltransferase involved in cell wall biosynthesis